MTQSPPDSPRRRPKGDKRARTRAKIVEAAAFVTLEKGFEHATVQEIARRAGVSNGAVYGNFKNRDELFASIGPAYWPRVRVQVKAGASFPEIMRALAEATVGVMPERQRRGAGRYSGLAYGLTNEALRAASAGNAVEAYARAESWWRSVIDEDHLPAPVDIWVRIVAAMIEGLTYCRLFTPELTPDEVIYAAFEALTHRPPVATASRTKRKTGKRPPSAVD
jgi:hypothetical protein